MATQVYIDTGDAFQEVLDSQLERLKRLEDEKKAANAELEEADRAPEFVISKARLFSAAVYAAAMVDLDVFADFVREDLETHGPPSSVAEERRLNRDVPHKFVFLRPLHVDYILLRRGELGVHHGVRVKSDRDFLHIATRYFASLNDANAMRFLALSETIHPKSRRHAKT